MLITKQIIYYYYILSQVDKKIVTKIAQLSDEKRDEVDFNSPEWRMVKQNCDGTKWYATATKSEDTLKSCNTTELESGNVPFAASLHNETELTSCGLGWAPEGSNVSSACENVFISANFSDTVISCNSSFSQYSAEFVRGMCEFSYPNISSTEEGCEVQWDLRYDVNTEARDGKERCKSKTSCR